MMKKMLLVVMLVALPIMAIGVSAQPSIGELTALASVFPANETMIFAAVRTDDGFIDQLDRTFAPLYPLADDLPSGFTFRSALDEAVQDTVPGGTFDSVVRPVLGDVVAVATFVDPRNYADPSNFDVDDATEDMEAIVAVEITSKAAVQQALADIAQRENVELQSDERSGYTVYEIPFGPVIAVNDTIMIVGEEYIVEEMGVIGGDFASLDTSTNFSNTMNALQTDSYNAVVYLNQPAYLKAFETVAESGAEFSRAEALEGLPLMRNIGSIGVGVTILNDVTLVADAVVAGGSINLPGIGAINPSFAGRIPSSTPFLFHSTNFKGAFDSLVATLDPIAEADGEDLDAAIAEINGELQKNMNMNLDDAIGWMTGDYALLMGVSDSAREATSIFSLIGSNPIDVGMIVDASSNPAAAINVVNSIETALNGAIGQALKEADNADVDFDLSRENDVLTLSIRDLSGDLPFPLELKLGVMDNIFFFGTPGTMASTLNGDGGLNNTTNFQAASSVFLPDSSTVYYIDFDNLVPVVDILDQVGAEEADTADLRTLLNLLDTATVSSSVQGDVSRVRATISLSQ